MYANILSYLIRADTHETVRALLSTDSAYTGEASAPTCIFYEL